MMGQFKICVLGSAFLISGGIDMASAFATTLPPGGFAISKCELKDQSGRAAQLTKIQMKVAQLLAAEIEALLKFHGETLAMDRRIQTTPELDEYIDKKGYNIKWRGINTSQAQVWGYMNHYDTAIDTPWLPYRWMIFGGGFKTPREVYGYIPGEFVPTVKQYLLDYPKAVQYISSRQAALERDEEIKSQMRAVLVASIVSTAFSFPTTASLTFGAVARIAWDAFEGNVQSYVQGLANKKAEEWIESVLNHGLSEHPQREEIVRKQVESALELVDPKEAQKIVSTIYSLHYVTRDKLQSLAMAVDMAAERAGGIQELDLAGWVSPTLEAGKSSQTEVEYFRDQRALLERKCLDQARAAQAIAPNSRTLRGMKNGDLAYANIVKERAECIVNQHYLLMVEMKWLADLGVLTQQVCERMKAAGL